MAEQTQTNQSSDSSDPDRLQDDIRRTRENIDRSLEAVERKLSPGELLQEVFNMFRSDGESSKLGSKAGDMMSGLSRTIKDHPVPSALIGIGLLGLLRDGDSEHGDGAQRAKHAAGELGERAKHAAERLGDKAKEGLDSATDTIEDLAEDAKISIQRSYKQARHRVEDDPLVLGAIGVALGAALGAGIPGTRVEERMFGEQAKQVREGAKQVAHEAAAAFERGQPGAPS